MVCDLGDSGMKLALVFEANLEDGGGYQTQLTTIDSIINIKKADICIIVFSQKNYQLFESLGYDVHYIENTVFDKAIIKLNNSSIFNYLKNKIKLKSVFESELLKLNIDLVYFLAPSNKAKLLQNINFIFTVWDLCHRERLEFPEVSFNGEFDNREDLYQTVLKKSTAIITDSNHGKRNIIKYYNIDESRIYPLSFKPSNSVMSGNLTDIKSKYRIDCPYIYYPAQFWAHKNHIYIIDALRELKDDGIMVKALFSGSDKGNLKLVLDYAHKKGVGDLIQYIGFVPNEDIYSLYKNAVALVMPSYFGPTNIPPLEAFFVGTPVIYSDFDFFREQTKDVALYCDLNQPKILAEQINLLLTNDLLRDDLISKGKKYLVDLQQQDGIDKTLEKIIIQFESKIKCWKL